MTKPVDGSCPLNMTRFTHGACNKCVGTDRRPPHSPIQRPDCFLPNPRTTPFLTHISSIQAESIHQPRSYSRVRFLVYAMPTRAIRALRALVRPSPARHSLLAKFEHPVPVATVKPAQQTTISCLRSTDFLSVSRISTEHLPETLLAFRRMASWRAAAAKETALAAIDDTLVFFRTSIHEAYVTRVARTLRRRRRGNMFSRFTGTRALSASVGMGLTAAVAREDRDPGPESLLRLLSSTEGPHRIGVGVLPSPLRALLAAFLAWLTMGGVVYTVMIYPHIVPWLLIGAAVCFATRPDLDSFLAWTKRCAPIVAKNKKMLVDKIRTQVAPYIMGLRPPVLKDYGLFSVVTLMDHADYVYVYAGFMSRWCLLGWYNAADDYNFDKIRAIR